MFCVEWFNKSGSYLKSLAENIPELLRCSYSFLKNAISFLFLEKKKGTKKIQGQFMRNNSLRVTYLWKLAIGNRLKIEKLWV